MILKAILRRMMRPNVWLTFLLLFLLYLYLFQEEKKVIPFQMVETVTLPIKGETIQSATNQDRKCPQHSPSLVQVSSPNRNFCYGATSLKGPKVCPSIPKDFSQPLLPSMEWMQVVVRGQPFAIRPNMYLSTISQEQKHKNGITLVTQGSWNRLSFFVPLAMRWRGPISVALLFDSDNQIEELDSYIAENPLVAKYIDIHGVVKLPRPKKYLPSTCGDSLSSDMREKIMSTGLLTDSVVSNLKTHNHEFIYKCQFTCVGFGASENLSCQKDNLVCRSNEKMGKLQEQIQDLQIAIESDKFTHPACPFHDNQYPVNMLRNVALQCLKTEWVMNIDIDVIPSSCMQTFLETANKAYAKVTDKAANKFSCDDLFAFVLPAVEMSKEALDSLEEDVDSNEQCFKINKDTIVDSLEKKIAKPMHLYFPPAYGPTDFLKWMKMTDQSPYEVKYGARFEPYYIAKMPVPMFDWDFVDRGGNFAQQVLELHAGGYRFFVLPDIFVVDIPHTVKTVQQTYDNQRLSNALWRRFYLQVASRYGVKLPPYKGKDYRRMRERLDLKLVTFIED